MELTYATTQLHGLEVLSCKGDRHFSKHLHDDYVLWLNSESGERFHLQGTGSVLEPGSISIIEPGVVHENHPCDPQKRHLRSFYFGDDFLARISFQLTGEEKSGISMKTKVVNNPALWQRFSELHHMLLQNHDMLELESSILLVFDQLFRQLKLGKGRHNAVGGASRRVDRVVEYFCANLDGCLMLDELASLVDCSSYHLIRLFRQEKGVTPHAYLVQLRLEYARKLLKEGCTIADAALQAGFSDQSHFTRKFKLRYGVTPGSYLKQSCR